MAQYEHKRITNDNNQYHSDTLLTSVDAGLYEHPQAMHAAGKVDRRDVSGVARLAALGQRAAVVVLQLLRQHDVVLVHWCGGGRATLGGRERGDHRGMLWLVLLKCM